MPINDVELTTSSETIIHTFSLCVGDNYVECNILVKVHNDLTHQFQFSDIDVCRSMTLNLRLPLRQLFKHSVYEWVIIMLEAI